MMMNFDDTQSYTLCKILMAFLWAVFGKLLRKF